MGKYMRRRAAGEEVAAVEVTQVVGVRTRSRSAAATTGGGVAKVAPARRKKQALTAAGEPAAAARAGGGGDGGSCYIHLRSRMLFMAPPPPVPTAPAEAAAAAAGAAGQQGPALAAGLSRCSSTASSMDIGGGEHRSHAACRSDAAEVGGDHAPDVSANNSGSSSPPDRERREMTPSSRAHGGELSDLESDLAGHKTTARSSFPPETTSAAVPIVPPAQEIEDFFAAAEAAHAKRFASKYNFDFVRGVPLDAGRFEWTPVFSI